jgi:hypothetical protein
MSLDPVMRSFGYRDDWQNYAKPKKMKGSEMAEVMKIVEVEALEDLGYSSTAMLLVQPDMGRYVVTLMRVIPGEGTESCEVAWEPSEPDRQKAGVEWALDHSEDAVLDAAKIDIDRRENPL